VVLSIRHFDRNAGSSELEEFKPTGGKATLRRELIERGGASKLGVLVIARELLKETE
jgi:hypothetical protein